MRFVQNVVYVIFWSLLISKVSHSAAMEASFARAYNTKVLTPIIMVTTKWSKKHQTKAKHKQIIIKQAKQNKNKLRGRK